MNSSIPDQPMNFFRIFIVCLVGFSMVAVTGCKKEKSKTPASKQGGGKVPVEVMVIGGQTINNVIFSTGTLLPDEETGLRPEIPGRITGIHFTEGDWVKKGQLLFKINDAELKAQLAKTEILEKQAADDEFRKRKLVEINAISQEEYDISLNNLNAVKADKAFIQAQIDKTAVNAPFDGVIGLRQVSPGSYVNTGQILATIRNINPLKLEFSVPEKYSGMLNTGYPVSFALSASEKQYNGKVYVIDPGIEPSTRAFKVRALCRNDQRELFPGAFAKVTVNLGTINNAVMVPSEAIIPQIKGQNVFLFKSGKVVSTEVETGLRTADQVQIVTGLKSGDTLICTGLLQIRNGSEVEIRKYQELKQEQL